MTERQAPLDPALAPFATCSLASLAPQHAEAVGTLREVIGRFHAWDVKKGPQCLAFSLQAPGKRPGLILVADGKHSQGI